MSQKKLWISCDFLWCGVSSPSSVPGGGSTPSDDRRWWQRRLNDDRWGRRQIIAVVTNFSSAPVFRFIAIWLVPYTPHLLLHLTLHFLLFTSSSLYITAASHLSLSFIPSSWLAVGLIPRRKKALSLPQSADDDEAWTRPLIWVRR